MKKTYEYMIKTTGEPYGKKVRAGNCFLVLSPDSMLTCAGPNKKLPSFLDQLTVVIKNATKKGR